MSYILLALFILIMYNFVTRFVLPIYMTSKRVKEQFRNIREHQEAYQKQYQQQQHPPQQEAPKEKEKVGEYIEFEEVK
ncbi:MAG: hypothetical protein BGN92_00805 [Sphingobacteriales bacterium 41-5]|nr:MAG: hypothetical protein ABS67_01150 [Niabella sp. SCN 42-15]OJU24738.1 MAG: hypothetical protein BGN92_00805 [Sphingobacteriales bacterium 41-5]